MVLKSFFDDFGYEEDDVKSVVCLVLVKFLGEYEIWVIDLD